LALHLVIGAGEFLASHVSMALASEVPVIELNADADDETLADAITSVEVVHLCAQTWSPARRLRYRKEPPALLERVVAAARKAGVRRIVHVSSADVYGPDHFARVNEKSRLRPVHPYERLKLFEEQWLLKTAQDVEVIVLRPARVFGPGDDWLLPQLMRSLGHGRLWLPGGGRATQTFIAASDVGRACLAAADRGRPGRSYLIGGFDSTWREYLQWAAWALDRPSDIGSIPYDLAFIRALAAETMTAPGAPVWPGTYALDVIGKPHYYDDSYSRRELTWSPAVGSFEQAMPPIAAWLGTIPGMISVPKPEPTPVAPVEAAPSNHAPGGPSEASPEPQPAVEPQPAPELQAAEVISPPNT
jgi:nucleoside-diphosphate-sugar epimerase